MLLGFCYHNVNAIGSKLANYPNDCWKSNHWPAYFSNTSSLSESCLYFLVPLHFRGQFSPLFLLVTILFQIAADFRALSRSSSCKSYRQHLKWTFFENWYWVASIDSANLKRTMHCIYCPWLFKRLHWPTLLLFNSSVILSKICSLCFLDRWVIPVHSLTNHLHSRTTIINRSLLWVLRVR